MPSFGHFNIPADDVDRAREFYHALLGWKIEPDHTLENKSLEWHTILTGEPEEGKMNRGGLFKRYVPGPIINFLIVEDFDRVYGDVERLGGRIIMPREEIPHVGTVAVIGDTEGNVLGLLKPQ